MRATIRLETLTALTSLLLACPAPVQQDAPIQRAPAPVQPAAEVAPAVQAAPARPARTGERPARRPLTTRESAALGEYAAAMQVGRTQTRAKAHAEAIAGFDRALTLRPNDARALAERGYAKLLAKDLEGARRDLEAARQRTEDPARLGPIWFNVGLVAEAAGNREGALRAFTLSNQLRPSKAAAARIDGAAVCTAEIDRASRAGRGFAGWKALYEHLIADTEEPRLAGDDAVRNALCFDPKADAAGVWDLCFYNAAALGMNAHASLLVGRAADGALVLFDELGFAESGSCQPHGALTVTPIGDLVHARYVEFAVDSRLVPGDPARGARACEGEGEVTGCELDCVATSARVDDFILDLRGKQQVLRVRRTTHEVKTEDPRELAAGLAIDVTVSPERVTVTGGGCDESLAIGAARR